MNIFPLLKYSARCLQSVSSGSVKACRTYWWLAAVCI